MKAVGLANFTQEVIKNDEPVLVDFWAEWCVPCRHLKPTLEEVGKQAKIVTVDIEKESELTAHYAVGGIPTVIVFKNGKPVKTLTGVHQKQAYLELVNA